MFRLIHRPSHKQTLFSPRPVRLLLEPLEDRNSPSTITLNVAYAANHHVILSGQVTAGGWGAHTDGEWSGVTVQISGAASGSTKTDANGNYSVDLTASSLGQVQAKTADILSNTATATLTSNTPTIELFGVVAGPLNFYTFSGQVTGDVTGGMVITFGGQVQAMNGRTVTVDADGYFAISVQINSNDLGTVTATATDWWGIYSDEVAVLVS
jgi:hypothetical protein